MHWHYKYPEMESLKKMWDDAPGDTNGDKGGSGNGDGETVAKADYDKMTGDLDKAKQDLEDMRMEVLSPEYLEYLGTKDKGKADDKSGDDAGDTKIPDDKLNKLTPKEILALAEERAEAKFKTRLDKLETDRSSESKAQSQREVDAFARTHEDFSTYRPIMYGLSLDPKNKGLSLQELYGASKEHVKNIHTEPSDAEKKRQQKIAGEKPGGSAESYEDLRKLSAEEATKQAADEVVEKLGSIPAA